MSVVAPRIVDVQLLLENYAWQHFQDMISIQRSKSEWKGLDREDVVFDINLKHLITVQEEPEYVNLHPNGAKPYCLFKTVFINNTSRTQEYSFKTERATESLCLVAKEQGYTTGIESEFGLKTPCEILEFKAGFKHEMSFSRTNENSVAETLTWGVDSNISVPGQYQTTAELLVEEMNYTGTYCMVSHLSGRVVVALRRRKDGLLIMPISAAIREIFRDLLDSNSVGKETKSMITIEPHSVRLVSRGQCKFQFATKQRIELTEQPIVQKEVQSQTSVDGLPQRINRMMD